jgi:V8-like Glu-specific endopeptidase
MSKRSLIPALVVLCCASAGAQSMLLAEEAVEASAWVLENGADDVVAAVSTPGLAQRLYEVPKTAMVIPERVTERLTAAARAKAGAEGKQRLIGVHVPLASAAPRWDRIEGPNGTSWRLAIVSEGAVFVRPHFPAFPSSAEAVVVVYGASPDQPAAVVTPTPTATSSDVWGPLVEGSVLFVEVMTASGEEPSLVVDAVSSGIPKAQKQEDGCYLDVSCYSYWKSTKTAIGQMVFEQGASTFVCSGSMITDKSHSGKPYFLTANHCISTQKVADSLLVFFKFGTSSCNGSHPTLSLSLPHTSGSNVKATSRTSDVTLLQLDKKPPSGTTYAGWTTQSLSNGTDVTVIHHPAGTYKRISFADIVSGSGNFWTVVYAESSTEGGSSGSPLLLDSTKQIVGQLFRGDAACANPTGVDEYGKFSVSFSKLSSFLNK